MVILPGALVEAVIALSIAYVAAENLFPKFAISRRWTVSFLFGLVHGFGFSSVLKEIGLPKENLLLSLLNFNLGVEAGQAAVVLLCVPILLWIRSVPWEPRARHRRLPSSCSPWASCCSSIAPISPPDRHVAVRMRARKSPALPYAIRATLGVKLAQMTGTRYLPNAGFFTTESILAGWNSWTSPP